MKIERGVMVMKNGKAWGKICEDGNLTAYGWVDAEEAPIHDPNFCKNPTDVDYEGSYNIPELRTAELVLVEKRTEVVVLGHAKDQHQTPIAPQPEKR